MAGYLGTYVLEYQRPDTNAWVDLTCYLYTCQWQWGRDYSSQLIGRATPFTATVTLNNQDGRFSRYNEASPYYFPTHDPPFHIRRSTSMRFRMTDPTATTLWRAYITDVRTEHPLGRPGVATIALTGMIGKVATEAPTIPTTHWQDFDSYNLISAMLDDWYAELSSYSTPESDLDGANVVPIWWLTRPQVVEEVRLIETAEGGYIGDANDGVIFHNRTHRETDSRCTTSQAAYSDATTAALSYAAIVPDQGERDIANVSTVTVTTYTHDELVGSNPFAIVWTHPDEGDPDFYIEPGATLELTVSWDALDKPTGAAYVIEWLFDPLTLTVNGFPTAMQAFTAVGGGGTDISSDIDVTTHDFPVLNSLHVVWINNNAARAYLYHFSVAAQFGYTIQSVTYSARDEDSIDAYGPRTYPIETPWVAPSYGPSYPQFIVDRYGSEHERVIVGFRANASQALLEDLVDRRIADRVSVEANRFTTGGTYLGINQDFFVERLEHQVDRNLVHTVAMHLSPAPALVSLAEYGIATAPQMGVPIIVRPIPVSIVILPPPYDTSSPVDETPTIMGTVGRLVGLGAHEGKRLLFIPPPLVVPPIEFTSSLLTSLVAYWKLDESSGTATDSAGSNTLADNNTVTSSAGKVLTSRQFTAANSEYLSIADNTALSMGDIDFTIAAWVYGDTLPGTSPVILGKFNGTGDQREYALWYNSSTSRLSLIISSDGTTPGQVIRDASSFGAPSATTWYLIIAWHDASANTLNICINNGTVDSTSHSAGVFNGTAPFQMGAISGPGQFWNGRIDEVGIWKKVLTATERATLYNGGVGMSYPF